jgi:hypothetical protein
MRGEEISTAERTLWQQMSFREFFILMLRLQALWLLFNAAMDLTFLIPYLAHMFTAASGLKPDLFWPVMRVILRVAAAFALIQQAGRIATWFVKDWLSGRPAEARSA